MEKKVSNLVTAQTGTGHYLGELSAGSIVLDIRLRMKYMSTFLKTFFTWPLHQIVRLLLCMKIIPVFIAKEAMQIKPGLSFDEKQKQFVGSKMIKIDSKYISNNPDPDK